MKLIFVSSLLLICHANCVAQIEYGQKFNSFNQSLIGIRQIISADSMLMNNVEENSGSVKVADSKSLNNSLVYTGYYMQSDDLPAINLHKMSLGRSQTLLKSSFYMTGDLFYNQNGFDEDRSGIGVEFDSPANISRIIDEQQEWLNIHLEKDRYAMFEGNSRYHQAKLTTLFQKYIETINSPEYQNYLDRVVSIESVVADSTTKGLENFDNQYREQCDFAIGQAEVLARLDLFRRNYKELYTIVTQIPYDIRSRAHGITDSLDGLVSTPETNAREVLLKDPNLSKIQRHLLNVEELSLGNTALGRDELTSIGLPIRGVNYIYDNAIMRAEVQAGRRVLPRRQYLPVQGVRFPLDRRNTDLFRILVGFHNSEKAGGDLSFITGKESLAELEKVPLAPRRNQVITLHGFTNIGKCFKAISTVSVSRFSDPNVAPAPAPIRQDFLSRSIIKGGVALVMKDYEFTISLFSTGANYVTLANPYLLTDLKGIESKISGSLLGGKLSGEFRFSTGVGTTGLTKDNYQWQGLGLMRYVFTEGHSLGLMATPNVFQINTANVGGASTNNIYQIDLSGRFGADRRTVTYRLSASNLNTGFNWGDTTQVTSATQFAANISMELSEIFRGSLSGTHRLAGQLMGNEALDEWSYSSALSYQNKVFHEIAFRYEKYRLSTPGFGLSYMANYSLSKNITIRLSLYGHLGRGEQPHNIYSSRHSLATKF